ncbi:MAG: DEAD/DEAH box helicase [Alphaproteobacteria bacterium]|nr:DEAD/DEAH box helicase [Alphaproteobacteria bacterium]
MTMFTDLGLMAPLCRAVDAEGYTVPTPIQARAIPHLLGGRDLLGVAQTGTGKTAAFALPILQRLSEKNQRPVPRAVRALILTPTRELACQIGDSFAAYGRGMHLRRTVVHGGVGMGRQVAALAGGVDILVATPGRLLDLVSRAQVRLDAVEIFVLDEADRMLDMGFIRDVQKIVGRLPVKRQTVLFSATMPQAVASLAASLLTDFERIEATPPATTVDLIDQRVLFVAKDDKRHLLVDLLKSSAVTRAIVFTRTKHGADRLVEQLRKGSVSADAIHGNKSQGARQSALDGFKSGRVRTLVATDIAARGIDVDNISHVINFDLPNEPESYVHRIGRTARAGTSGAAVSLCDADEIVHLRAIEKTIRRPVPVDSDHSYHADAIARLHADPAHKPKAKPNGGKPRVNNAPPSRVQPARGGRPPHGNGSRRPNAA